jgi:hypothetical protein
MEHDEQVFNFHHGDCHLTISASDDYGLLMVVGLFDRRVLFTLEGAAVIDEFVSLLHDPEVLEFGGWKRYQNVYIGPHDSDRAVNWRHKDKGITLGFSRDEWRRLGELIDKGLAPLEMQLSPRR